MNTFFFRLSMFVIELEEIQVALGYLYSLNLILFWKGMNLHFPVFSHLQCFCLYTMIVDG